LPVPPGAVENGSPHVSSAPDTVFLNGRIYDGTERPSYAGAVAVTDGVISAVGEQADIAALAGPGTRTVDVAGGLVMPGFVDAHIHPIEAGLERARCDLSGCATKDEYRAAIRAYAVAHPDLPWIQGGGWQIAAFPGGTPSVADLDDIVPDRPVFLENRDHHGAWVNSRAIQLAGLTATTPDPIDGRIERDATGSPSGTLHEGARHLVSRLIAKDTEAEKRAALLLAQDHLFSVGVTGWQDAIVGDYANHSDTGDIYLEAAKDGSLQATVVAALWWDRNHGDEQIPHLKRRRAELVHERFTAGSIKIMQDGIPENRTAAMVDPYLTPGCSHGDNSGTETGISFVDPTDLKRYVTQLDRDGFQLHVHAIGDRATRESLDAFEAALIANGPSDNRHHIAHLQIIDPVDLARFAPLGISANIQSLWATLEPQMVVQNIPYLGATRARWQYPFASLLRSGAALCAGSDWPVTDPNPWAAIHVAVNRTLAADDADYNPEAFLPEQALTLAQSLAAYTSGSNRINHRDSTGTITVGAEADLVLTNRDPFAGVSTEISETAVVATYVRGKPVFEV